VRRARLDGGQRLLDVVERASARGAGDVFGMREAEARRLENHQLDAAELLLRVARGVEPDAVGQAVEEERSQVGRRTHGQPLERGFVVVPPEHHRAILLEVENRRAELGRGVFRGRLEDAEPLHRLAPHDGHLHPAAAAELGGRIALGVEHLEAARTRGELLDELLRHGDFVLGGLGQRDANRVADAVGQQCTDAHGALDAPLEAVARLRHTQMNRIVHPLGIHRLDQQPVGVDHHARVARLHRDDHLVEIALAADAQELHRRDDHPLRRASEPWLTPMRSATPRWRHCSMSASNSPCSER